MQMETFEKKVSVIIPVYHAEKYIEQTLNSVLEQSVSDREILLVENGCGDQCHEILLKYAEKYEEIKIISCDVQGAGAARNAGLEKASGEFILFVDADDYLPDSGVLEKYLKAAKQTDADIIISNYARLWENRIIPARTHDAFSFYSPTSEEFRFQGFFSVGTLSYVWGRLYRRAFLLQNQLRFENLTYAEDKLFNMQCYLCGARYLFLSENGYIYRKNEASVSWQYHEDAAENWLHLAAILKEWMQKQKEDMEQYESMVWYTVFFAVFFTGKMEYTQHKKSIRVMRQVLKKYGNDPIGKETFQKLADKTATLQLHQKVWKLMIRVFATGMKKHWYGILTVGMKALIEMRMDERLSDTGIRDKKNSED